MDKIKNIIQGCIAQKRECQEKLYQLFADKMFGVCLRYCRNYEEAEDVLQEGFVKVFTNIKRFEFKGSFEGWIRKIIVNTALEKYRKKNHLYLIDDVKEVSNENYEDILNDMSAKDLLKMVQSLSPQYKMVFNLYAIEGYSHKEIGKKLGISEGTSKSNLSRARIILQEKLKKYNESSLSQIS